MKKSPFILHYDHLLASFFLYFNKVQKSQEMEDVHQLRVTIKKLRAMWSLMQVISGGQWRKKPHFDLFEQLFHAAGELREAQVNQELIVKCHVVFTLPYAEYLSMLQKRSGKKLGHIMQLFDTKSLDALNKELLQKIGGIPHETILEAANRYTLSKIHEVINIKDQLPDDRQLHKIRKRLKAIQEIFTIIKELNAKATLDTFQDHIKSLNQHIGKWHDYQVLLKSLHNFIEENPDNENDQLLKDLMRGIASKQWSRQEELVKMMDAWIGNAQLHGVKALL